METAKRRFPDVFRFFKREHWSEIGLTHKQQSCHHIETSQLICRTNNRNIEGVIGLVIGTSFLEIFVFKDLFFRRDI